MKGRCLILGGAGFIGANLVGSLLKSGYKVRVFDIVGFSRKNIEEFVNDIEIVDGEGVIGKKPVLKPGESHTYSSGCLLSSPFGSMKGYFNMINFTTTNNFRVIVPSFKLSAPFALN